MADMGLKELLDGLPRADVAPSNALATQEETPDDDDGRREWQIPSPDGKRMFVFVDFGTAYEMRMLNICLQNRTEEGTPYGLIFEVQQSENDEEVSYYIRLDAAQSQEVVDGGPIITFSDDGVKKVLGGWGSMETLEDGQYTGYFVFDIPEKIDMSATVAAFLDQVKRLDFQNPVLVGAEKPLLPA